MTNDPITAYIRAMDAYTEPPPPTRARHIADILLGRMVTLCLAAAAAALGVGSFFLMSSGAPLAIRPNLVSALLISNVSVLLLLAASLAGRLTPRLGGAASRVRGLAAACAAGAAVLGRRRYTYHRGRRVRHRLVLARHTVLVQRPDTHRAEGGVAGESGLPV